jgi:hypothetical protein
MGHVRVLEALEIDEQSLCLHGVVASIAKIHDHPALVPHAGLALLDVPPDHLYFRFNHAPAYTDPRAFDRAARLGAEPRARILAAVLGQNDAKLWPPPSTNQR